VAIHLACGLCGAVVADGAEPHPGTCGECGARYAGGGDDPPQAVAAALATWQITDLEPRAIADRIFRLSPDDPWLSRVNMVSDRRDGFYRWWLFVAAGDEPATALTALVEPTKS
jgi:hypothetical protein